MMFLKQEWKDNIAHSAASDGGILNPCSKSLKLVVIQAMH